MSLFKAENKRGDAVRNAISHMEPYWKKSRRNILEAYDTPGFVETVRQNYCPYGANGAYGPDFGKKGVFTLRGYDMRAGGIEFIYDPRMVETMTWREFAEIIGELIANGEYTEEE